MGNTVGVDASGPLVRWAFVFKQPIPGLIPEESNLHEPLPLYPSSTHLPKLRFVHEDILRGWFNGLDCWRQPWYDTHYLDGQYVRTYYLITCWSAIYSSVAKGVEILLKMKRDQERTDPQRCFMVGCTGSRRKNLRAVADEVIGMKHLMHPTEGYSTIAHFIKLKGMQEVQCSVRGLDFFLNATPSSCFNYKEHRGRLSIAGRWIDTPEDLLDLVNLIPSDQKSINTADDTNNAKTGSLKPTSMEIEMGLNKDLDLPLDSAQGANDDQQESILRNTYNQGTKKDIEDSSETNLPCDDQKSTNRGGSDQQFPLRAVTGQHYPYLLVHIKNGCSFHLVRSEGEPPQRVGGSVIGAGTFLGLASLLCPSVKNAFDAFLLACTGDNSKVDLLVSDIYGGSYSNVNLEGGLIASSFGKVQPTKFDASGLPSRVGKSKFPSPIRERSSSGIGLPTEAEMVTHPGLLGNDANLALLRTLSTEDKKERNRRRDTSPDPPNGNQTQDYTYRGSIGREKKDEERTRPPKIPATKIEEQDLARSLLTLVTYNLTHQAYLNALLHRVPRIVFSGFYLEMPGYLSALQACVNFWDDTGGIGGVGLQEPIDPVFIRMAPFLAAVGAAL